MKRNETMRNALIYSLLILITVFSFFPVFWVVLSAFKPEMEIIRYPPTLIPERWTFENYKMIFQLINLAQSFKNSFIVMVICTAGVVLTSAMAGYALSIIKVRGKKYIIGLIMLGVVMPTQTTYIPLYTLASQTNMLNTFQVMILPFLTSAFGAFFVSQVFLNIPGELTDAATVDGLGHFGILFRIVIPLSKASLMTLIIFISMSIWREFYWPFLSVTGKDYRTVPLAVAYFVKSDYSILWGHNLAVSAVACIPLILVYFICQKYFVEGMVWSGIKQ